MSGWTTSELYVPCADSIVGHVINDLSCSATLRLDAH
jgi:hypothetical protein